MHLLSQSNRQAGIDRAAVSGMVIGRLQVSSSAVGVTSLADGSRARGLVGATVGGLDGETVLGELGAGSHVDAREIPEDGVGGLGVLELEDIGLALVCGQLDGDTTTVRVGLPLLGVGTTVCLEGLHRTDVVGDRPGVDVLVEVVGDQDATAGGLGVALDNWDSAGGKGRSQGSEDSSHAESLSEHHFE